MQYEIREDKHLRGSSQSEKSHHERLLLKVLGERALVNNFLEYLYTAIILSYFILTNLKYLVLLFPIFILLVSILY